MLEEKNDNLQEAAEGSPDLESTQKDQSANEGVVGLESSAVEEKEDADTVVEHVQEKTEETEEEHVEEININNAEDAEDEGNDTRHEIPVLDYHSMTMEVLVVELERLVKNEKVQAIKTHIDGIKYEFDLKFAEFIEQKKEDFVAEGGNVIDFSYTSTVKNNFKKIYGEYRERKNQYYKDLELSLKQNLIKRKEIIEELKGLLNVEEDINSTYKHFKTLQDQWRHAGAVPRAEYNDIWRTYHHHVERFYDFLHLNRDLRDLDFKHNLEEKIKIVERAEALQNEQDLGKAFRELQTLHKIWKEDLGPVGKEHREEIWNRFSNATKELHQKRQEYYKQLDQVYEKNLIQKNEIIQKIKEVVEAQANSHSAWQQQIKVVEALRNDFFNAGKVPQRNNEDTWNRFKEAVRSFNRGKNSFYKTLKKEQQANYDKKMALIEIAESLKDSTDWETVTPQMKKIQADWKKIGHVPRRSSDKIWKRFKEACNSYFDAYHAQKNAANKEEVEALEKKQAFLEKLKVYQLSGDKEIDLKFIKEQISSWKEIGRVPYNKKNIDNRFHKIIDALFKKLDMNKEQVDLMKYSDRLDALSSGENMNEINRERAFIKRKIDDIKDEIRQLENNLLFFSNASESNPLVRDVYKNINKHKAALGTWKSKLKSLNILQHKVINAGEKEGLENSKEEGDAQE